MSDPALRAQLDFTLSETQLDGLGSRYRGKVRDVYRKDDRLFLIATDRLSAFDKVLTTIPFKGEVLNRLAQFWFEKTAHVAKNHVLDVPDPNVTVARATQPFPIRSRRPRLPHRQLVEGCGEGCASRVRHSHS